MSEENQAPRERERRPSAGDDKSLERGTLLVLALVVLTLLWYLTGDRYTPYSQQARVQAYVVGVAPKVAGVVTRVWVRNNQRVEQDQPLFQIDRQSYEIALLRARADLKNAESKAAAARSSIAVAEARLESALANEEKARKDAVRQEKLYKKDPGAISVRRVEVAQATFKQARAKVSAAEADLQEAIEREKGSRDRLEAARSSVDKARLDLENTLVRASAAGIITDLRVDVGHYAATGKPVMTLVSDNDFWIEAHFTENNLGHLRSGTPVEFVLDALPGKVFSGRVGSIGLGVSAGQAPPPGTLPTIQNSRDWLRQAQRFPVVIDFDTRQDGLDVDALRVGGQAEVIAYSEDAWLLAMLGRLFIRFMSLMSYAY